MSGTSSHSLVSVIIPCYNYGAFVQRAVDSVLAQTHKAVEVIVVDDGSTDDSAEILKAYGDRIVYVYQENQRMSAARNNGIRRARGEYIALIDADDIWLPDKLEKQLALFDRGPESLALVFAWADLLIDGERIKSRANYREQAGVLGAGFRDTLFVQNVIATSSVVIKRSCLNDVGLFDEKMFGSEDWDVWLRLAKKKYHFGVVAEPLVLLRQHATSMSKKIDLMIEYNERVFERNLPDDYGWWKRFRMRRRAMCYSFFSSGTECHPVNPGLARKLYARSMVEYPWPGFYPQRYAAFLRTVLPEKWFKKLRAVLKPGAN